MILRKFAACLAILLCATAEAQQSPPWRKSGDVIIPRSTTIKGFRPPTVTTANRPSSATLGTITTDSDVSRVIVGDGTTWQHVLWASDIGPSGTVQGYDAGLNDIAGLAVADGNFIVGNGTNWIVESGATALASIGGQAADADLDTWATVTPGSGIAAALAIDVGSAGAPVILNGAGGTPSALVLTNATGLPLSSVVDSTSEALGVGSLEIGHATDTTLARSAAGAVTIEGVDVALNSATLAHTAQTLELGHATDTTLSRTGAGAIAVEGVDVALNSITLAHTAQQIELGHATDTTITRESAGVAAIEGETILTGDGHTGTNGSAALGSNFAITATSGTYEASGLTVTLPEAGEYLVTWHARGLLNTTAAGTLIVGRLRNTTDSTDIDDSFAHIVTAQVASLNVQDTKGATCIVDVAASKTLELYVQRNGSGFTTTQITAAGIGGGNGTVISYVKIAD